MTIHLGQPLLSDAQAESAGLTLQPEVRKQMDLAESLNNTLQNMWRSALGAGLTLDNAVFKRIDETIAAWELWWERFKDSVASRQVDAVLDMGWGLFTVGADWNAELAQWEARIVKLDRELKDYIARTAGSEVAAEYSAQLQNRGEAPKLQQYRKDSAAKRGAADPATRFLLGLGAVGVLVGAGFWMARRRRRY